MNFVIAHWRSIGPLGVAEQRAFVTLAPWDMFSNRQIMEPIIPANALPKDHGKSWELLYDARRKGR